MNQALDDLKSASLVLLICDVDPRYGHEIDPVFEVMEFASFNQIRLTRDTADVHDCILVLTAPEMEWWNSKRITKHIMLAQKRRLPVYFYKQGKVLRARSK